MLAGPLPCLLPLLAPRPGHSWQEFLCPHTPRLARLTLLQSPAHTLQLPHHKQPSAGSTPKGGPQNQGAAHTRPGDGAHPALEGHRTHEQSKAAMNRPGSWLTWLTQCLKLPDSRSAGSFPGAALAQALSGPSGSRSEEGVQVGPAEWSMGPAPVIVESGRGRARAWQRSAPAVSFLTSGSSDGGPGRNSGLLTTSGLEGGGGMGLDLGIREVGGRLSRDGPGLAFQLLRNRPFKTPVLDHVPLPSCPSLMCQLSICPTSQSTAVPVPGG